MVLVCVPAFGCLCLGVPAFGCAASACLWVCLYLGLCLAAHAHNASHFATHHDCSVHVFWLTRVYVDPLFWAWLKIKSLEKPMGFLLQMRLF